MAYYFFKSLGKKWTPIPAFMLFYLSLSLTPAAAFESCVKIAQWSVGTRLQQVAQEIVLDAYNRAGICYQLVDIPILRSNDLLKSGEIDAMLWRASEFVETSLEFAVAVPTPILVGNVSLIYDTDVYQPDDIISQIKGKPIGITLGTSNSMELIDNLQGVAVTAPAYRQLFQMFTVKRFAAIIMPEDLFMSYASKKAFTVKYDMHPLYQTKVYHVLGIANQGLAMPLAFALKSVLDEASFFDRLEAIN